MSRHLFRISQTGPVDSVRAMPLPVPFFDAPLEGNKWLVV